MIIEFAVENFRSIQSQQVFAFEADSGKSKGGNVAEFSSDGEEPPRRLLRSAVMYGANASGKSNFIRAFQALRLIATKSGQLNAGDRIPYYQPFAFDAASAGMPTKFRIRFMGKDGIVYDYQIHYNRSEILLEKLDFYPNGYPTNLFEREATGADIHSVKRGRSLKGRDLLKELFRNQSYLSKYGSMVPNRLLTPVFQYLSELTVYNVIDAFKIDDIRQKLAKEIASDEGGWLIDKLSFLMRIADTGISSISTRSIMEEDLELPSEIPDQVRALLMDKYSRKVVALHPTYVNGSLVGHGKLDLDEESTGTNVLFALGGVILKVLRSGGVLVVDELDNSLHPKLVRFLIRLFNNPVTNSRNAQLIFATHEVTLLDRDIFRKDQIWFAEKNKFQQSEFFRAADVVETRDDTNFEMWYRTGKFGGYPEIKEAEFVFSSEGWADA